MFAGFDLRFDINFHLLVGVLGGPGEIYELLKKNEDCPDRHMVIVLDEVDKVRSNGGSGALDPEAALQPLLTLLDKEGKIKPPGHDERSLKKCMFILLANQGLDAIRQLPMASNSSFADAYNTARENTLTTWLGQPGEPMRGRVCLFHLFLPLTEDTKIQLVRFPPPPPPPFSLDSEYFLF